MKRWTATAVASCAVLFGAAPAHAAVNQESMFQDDTLLVYQPASEVGHTLDALKSLGVDRVRVSVYWRLVAPNAGSPDVPKFGAGGASDPANYPRANWKRYDLIVRMARDRGLAVNFNVDGPAPDWAMPQSPDPQVADHYYPSPGAFGSFVKALGTRYSGTYVPPGVSGRSAEQANGIQNTAQVLGLGPLFGKPGGNPPPDNTPPDAPEGALPRVSYWSIWNEPNQSFFLAPQWGPASGVRGGRAEAAPKIYRSLVDSASKALVASGHQPDTVLIGETAPKGNLANSKLPKSSLSPLQFIRRLYCVDDRLHFLRGAYARAEGCPTSNQRAAFPAAHPALFYASGFAHHPYGLLTAPQVRTSIRDWVALADLSRLTSTLSSLNRAYGLGRLGTPDIYITEYGYQSRPPDPLGFTLTQQAAYINQSEFVAYTNPHVRSYDQFLLRDAAPNPAFPKGSLLYYSTFQTGLAYLSGRLKPSFYAFRTPIWVPGARRASGGSFRVWGVLRPARNGAREVARIQYRSKFVKNYRTIKTVTIKNTRNVVDTRVNIPVSGNIRIVWKLGSRTFVSRAAPITIGR